MCDLTNGTQTYTDMNQDYLPYILQITDIESLVCTYCESLSRYRCFFNAFVMQFVPPFCKGNKDMFIVSLSALQHTIVEFNQLNLQICNVL